MSNLPTDYEDNRIKCWECGDNEFNSLTVFVISGHGGMRQVCLTCWERYYKEDEVNEEIIHD